MDNRSDQKIDAGCPVLYQRVRAACVGSLFSSLLVTPLDVVKTRLQAQNSTAQSAGFFSKSSIKSPSLQGTLDGLIKIVRHEGPLSLWRGLSATLIMAVPGNAIYFYGYETFKSKLQANNKNAELLVPLVAGSVARSIAVICVTPIELLRTRMQGLEGSMRLSLIESVKSVLRIAANPAFGLRFLFRGLSPTLWRDVPFSAIYWTLFENTRSLINSNFSVPHTQSAFIAGASSGMLAAAITTPFDVAKTRRQLNPHELPSMWRALYHISVKDGLQGLFLGIVPRVGKVAPACAIMIGTYEYVKSQ